MPSRLIHYIQVVIPEPVIVQSRLGILVLPLILERYERGWPFPLLAVDVEFRFESLLINRSDNAATQRHFLELLEHEVALAVVVVEMFAVFGQPFTSVIFAVVLLARSASISGFPPIAISCVIFYLSY